MSRTAICRGHARAGITTACGALAGSDSQHLLQGIDKQGRDVSDQMVVGAGALRGEQVCASLHGDSAPVYSDGAAIYGDGHGGAAVSHA
eukprot:1789254-Rhodomonas_salina.4